jgi:hypothetical protein
VKQLGLKEGDNIEVDYRKTLGYLEMTRMRDSFFDTYIILYLLDDNSHKAEIAESLLKQGGHISIQVLNETLVNLLSLSALVILARKSLPHHLPNSVARLARDRKLLVGLTRFNQNPHF